MQDTVAALPPAPPTEGEGRKKATTKAERRAIQEEQRARKEAAKAAGGGGKGGSNTGGGGGGGGGGSNHSGGGTGAGASKPAVTGGTSGGPPRPTAARMQHDDAKRVQELHKKQVAPRTTALKQVPLFAHLPQYEKDSSLSAAAVAKGNIHPAVLRLGLQISEGIITGSNARVVGMLRAFQQFIRDFEPPATKVFSRELDAALKLQIQYLVDCRPQSMAMGNGIKWIKNKVTVAPPHLSNEQVKEMLCASIDTFISEKIHIADQAIIANAISRVAPGDVVLVYSSSYVVEKVLLHTWQQGINFRVIIADAGPRFEGRELMRRLLAAGLRCTYVNLHALSYMMPEVTKLLLGASSMLLNGTLVARAGTALVCMLAHEHGVPALVCCETYKFAERVLLDSICFNELGGSLAPTAHRPSPPTPLWLWSWFGDLLPTPPILADPDELIPQAQRPGTAGRPVGGTNTSPAANAASAGGTAGSGGCIADWRDIPRLKLLNLLYDATPMKYLTMVVTEVGVIPPTSVPAVIREASAREAN